MAGAVPYSGRNREEKAEMKKRAYEMRLAGMTVREISSALGISTGTVSTYTKEASLEVISPVVEEYRQVEDERLDTLYQAAIGPALDGSARHIEMVLKLSERRAKLWGLDKPVVHEVKQHISTEIDERLAEVASRIFVVRDGADDV